MSAGENARKPVRPPRRAVSARWSGLAAWVRAQDRFWLWLSLAALVHLALIVGATLSLSTSAMRNMGDPGGSESGLSVELVDAADLESRSTVALEPPPSPPSAPLPPTPPQPPPVPEAQPTPPEEARPAPAPEEPKSTASIDKDIVPVPPLEGPAEKPVEKAQPKETKKAKETKEAKEAKETKEKAKPAPERDRLELSMPNLPNPTFAPGGRGSAVARPPNITRSGENDNFGREVIRALRQTMPQVNWLGRVSIRLLLTDKGNIQEVQLMRSGGDPLMDQNVVFAARQSNFPIPPAGSTAADRTFYVTYVYH